MSESITNRCQRLFEVRLLHHYWLDEGATLFDKILDNTKKDARLLTYDIRPVLSVVPTATTKKALNADRCLFRATPLGFIVAAPAGVVLPPDLVYEFVVSLKTAQFYDYTSLTLRPQQIHELLNTADGVLYRYKENVPVLSNLTGVTRADGAVTNLFLSQEIAALNPNDLVESIVQSGTKLQQLTSDGPGAATQDLAAQVSDFPVFVHQADVPEIVPPAGLVGAPARGLRLSADVTGDVFALISLTAVRGDDAAFSFVDGTGAPKVPFPVYQVRFKNRSTFWTYFKKGTGALDSATANPLPLTVFGNAGTKQKPSQGFVKAEMSGSKVARLISEIYI